MTSGHSSEPAALPSVAGNAALRLGATAVRVAVGLVSVPLLTAALGVSGWGLLALFQAAWAPFAVVELAVTSSTVKLVAEALGRRDREAAAGQVHTALLLQAAILAAGSAVLVTLSGWLAERVFSLSPSDVAVARRGFRLAAVAWVSGAFTGLLTGVLAAFQRYDGVAVALALGTVTSSAAAVLVARSTGDPGLVILAQGLVGLAAAAAVWVMAARLLPALRAAPRWSPVAFRRLRGFGGFQALASLGGLLASWGDRYLLGVASGTRSVGFYTLALSLQGQLYGIFLEAAEVLYPAISHRHGAGDLGGARRLSLAAGWTLTSAFGPLAVTLAVCGGDFLGLWISPEAGQQAVGALRLLCAAAILGMSSLAPMLYVQGIGRSPWQAASAIISGATVVAVGALLVPRYGILGVGQGVLAGVVIRTALVAALWRAHFSGEVNLASFAAHVWAPPATSLLLLLALVPAHDALALSPSWGLFLAEGILLAASCAAVQLGLGELLPGGSARRRLVADSFRPVLAGWAGRLRGRG